MPSRPPPIPGARQLPPARRRRPVGWLVLAIGLACTTFATLALHRAITLREQEHFAFSADEVRDAISSRLDTYTAMLRSCAALFAASERVSRVEFQEFVGRLELPRMYPGIQGIGFAARAPGGDKRALEARGRAEWLGATDEFHVWPDDVAQQEYFGILYLEPLDARNRAAIGFDMFSDPVRREAMERARDSGVPAMSGKVRLVQEIGPLVQPGFLVYVPVYRNGARLGTVEERRAALEGFVYSPFRAEDLFSQVLGPVKASRAGVTVYDGPERADEQRLYADTARAGSPALELSDSITVGGRTWTLDYHTLPGFGGQSGRALVVPALLGGAAISALLALIVTREARARAAADTAREQARAANEQLAQTLDTAAVGLVRVGRDLRYIAANPAYAEIAGLPAEAVAGRPVREVVGDAGFAMIRPYIDRVLSGERVEYEADMPWVAAGNKRIHVVYTPWRESDGTVSGWVASITDVTARAAAEKALRLSEARKTAVLQTALDAVITIDGEGRVVDYNPASERIFGYTREEAVGRELAELIIPPRYREAHREGLRRHMAGGVSVVLNRRLEISAIRKGGGEFPVELTITRTDVGGVAVFTGYVRDITDRREAEARVRESEARFRSFFDSLDQGFGLVEVFRTADGRPDYRFIQVNRVFEQQTGLSDALGKSIRELVPGHEEHWFELYDRIATTGVPERYVNEARQLGRWYDVYAARVGGEGSRTVALLFRDITSVRRGQARDRILLALEDATRALDDPQQITDTAAGLLGRHLHVNRCAYADVEADENTFNLTGDYNDGVPSIVGRYRFDQFGDECLRLMRAGQPFVVEDSEADPRCGQTRAAYRTTNIRSVVCVPLHKAGKFVSAMAVHQVAPRAWRPDEVELVQTVAARCWESIERARVARDLRDSEFRYRAFITNSSEGIWRLEIQPPMDTAVPLDEQVDYVYAHARFAECNDVMARMYGFASPDELVGRGLEMMLPPDDPQAREYIKLVLQSGYRIVEVESSEKDTRGNTLFFSNSMTGMVENGRLFRVWGTQRDITARKAAEEELARYRDRLEVMVQERTLQLESAAKRLRDSERLASLGTLAAGLGHDLHNALLPLRVHVEELEGHAADPRVRQNASAIGAVVGYLSELSRGMRMIAMDPGQEGPASTSPEQWQRDAGRIFQSGVGRGVEVVTTTQPDCPPLAIAPHRLTQAVFNLVQNAREAILSARGERGGGRIDIGVRCPPGAHLIEVTVADNGTGMTEEVRRHCMEPFYTTRTRAAGRSGAGTGMGLSIVAGIVHAAGGRVEIDSAPGVGSTFRLLIPPAAPATGDNGRPRRRAAIALKDPRQRAYVTALLVAAGYEPVNGEGGAAGGEGMAANGEGGAAVGGGEPAADLLVAEPATTAPERVHTFTTPGRLALVLNVPEDDHTWDEPHTRVHRRGQPLTALRAVVGELGGGNGSS